MEKAIKILIVDDEGDIRHSLQDLLSENNFQVFLAENAKQALEVLDEEDIDIVLADLVMPGMNGITLTREIIELDPSIPVIVMTGYASIEYAVESMKAGAVDFLSKPVKLNHTLFLIEKALETKRLREMAAKSDYYKKLSSIDELTGLHNHRFFKEALVNEIERHLRYNRQLSLLMIDIDNFKMINDRFGHLVGDYVLHNIAEVLKKTIRGCDLIARYGGEEFTAILPETSEQEATMVAERIVTTIQTHKFLGPDKQPLSKITVTVGLASLPKDATEAKQLLKKADEALYAGKKLGKNRIFISGHSAMSTSESTQ